MGHEFIVIVAELVFGLVCAVIFAISVTGRRGLHGWETKDLNRVALFSGLGFVCALLLLIHGATRPY